MKIKILCLIAAIAVILTPSVRVFANAPVFIDYDRAVEMAVNEVLAMRELDELVRDLQMQHNDLRRELRRLESGEVRREAIQDLTEALRELEYQIQLLSETMVLLQTGIGLSLRELFATIPFAGTEEIDAMLSYIFQSSVIGIISAAEISGGITIMETHRESILEAIENLQSDSVFREAAIEIRRALAEISRHIYGIRMQQEEIRLALEFGLRNIIALSWDLNLLSETLQKELELAESALVGLRVMNEVGFVSPHELFIAEHYIVQFRERLRELDYGKDSLMQGLNYMIGQPLSQNTVVEFERTLPAIPADITDHIRAVSMNTPTIRGLEYALENTSALWRHVSGNARATISSADRRRAMNADSRYAGDTDHLRQLRGRIAVYDAVSRADRELAAAIRTMEVSLRQGYNDLRILALQKAALQRELVRAQADLRETAANAELGLAVQRDVNEACMVIVRIERDIENNINQQWILGFALENPSLLGG